ncbi:hypothetical protein Hanom_Chr12g01111491 [Helianthus anomalus]
MLYFYFIGFSFSKFETVVILYTSANIPHLTVQFQFVLKLGKLLNCCVNYVYDNYVNYVRIVMSSTWLFLVDSS